MLFFAAGRGFGSATFLVLRAAVLECHTRVTRTVFPRLRRLHIVRANSNSPSAYRVMRSVERDMPKLRLVPIEPLNVTLVDRSDNGCRYPTNEGRPFLFCGRPHQPHPSGRKYCAEHSRLMFTEAPARVNLRPAYR